MSDNTVTVRTRIAPSPTGMGTIANFRTALMNFLFAKHHGGEFAIRIEDTDSDRFVPGSEEYFVESLTWLSILPDIGLSADKKTCTYRQSEQDYSEFIETLLATGHAYYAFDTSEELDTMRKNLQAAGSKNTSYNRITRASMRNSFTLSSDEVADLLANGTPHVIRFDVPRGVTISFNDEIRGAMKFNSSEVDDKILVKSDGGPSFHLANVVDDHRMGITHVIRGEEWLSSTPFHVLLYQALGWEHPVFAHVPLIMGKDGAKMSKRKILSYGHPVFTLSTTITDDSGNFVEVEGFREAGYEPEALVGFLALLGWNPGDGREFMTMDELIGAFTLERVNNSGAMFDIDKLRNFNANFMRSRSDAYLFETHIRPMITSDADYNAYNHISEVVTIAKERSVLAKELFGNVFYFFSPISIDESVELKNGDIFCDIMSRFVDNAGELTYSSPEAIKDRLSGLCNIAGFKLGKVLPDLRTALTGGYPGPDLPTTMWILGKEESNKRISKLLELCKTY